LYCLLVYGILSRNACSPLSNRQLSMPAFYAKAAAKIVPFSSAANILSTFFRKKTGITANSL
jgi:hypothetical protein